MGVEAGTVVLPVVPSAAGFLAALQQQIAPALAKIKEQGISSGAAIGTTFAVAGALAAKGLAAALNATKDLADATLTLQRTTGLAAEQASGLIFVADSLGVGVDKLNIGFGLLEKNIVNNAAGFTKYNIATQDASGGQLDLVQVLGNVSDKFEQVGGGSAGAALAMNIFGRSGKALIPILEQGSEGIQAMFDKAQSLGLIIGQDTVDSAEKLAIATRQLSDSFKGFEVQVGVALVPVVNLLVEGLTALVGVLHLIPAPLIDVAGAFLVLTGALAAIIIAVKSIGSTWGTVIGAFTEGTITADAQAEAMVAQVAASETLVSILPELTAALTALAAAQTEVAVTGAEMATAMTADATAAAAEDAAIVGFGDSMAAAGVGAAGAAAGFSVLGPALLAIGAGVGVLAALRSEANATHAALQRGIEQDFLTLETGSAAAVRRIKELAAQAPALRKLAESGPVPTSGFSGVVGHVNPAAADAPLGQQAEAASAALAQLHQQQLLAASSSLKLAGTLAGTVRAMTDFGDSSHLNAEQLGLVDASVQKLVPSLDKVAQASGVDLTQIVGDFKAVADNAKSTFPQVQAAAKTMVAQTHAAFQQWHDSIVQNFGGAGSALDSFANKANVDLAKATNHLTQYTSQIRSYGTDVKKITDEFGKRAHDFLQWATSQGLAQAGLVKTVADASKKNASAFVDAFNTGTTAADTLASGIQKALDPVFTKLISQLGTIKRALLGLPPKVPVSVDFTANTAAFQAEIQRLFGDLKGQGIPIPAGWLQLAAHGLAMGFHGQIDQPTLLLVGEAGSERVDVTPGATGTPGGGGGRITGQLAISDWNRGLATLQGELDHRDFVGAH